MHILVSEEEHALFQLAANASGAPVSVFARQAMIEKVERMRAEGKRF